jgi:hypothetical protein
MASPARRLDRPATPPSQGRRWTAQRKRALLAAIDSGALDLRRARALHLVSEEELADWRDALARDGLAGLRVYRPGRRPHWRAREISPDPVVDPCADVVLEPQGFVIAAAATWFACPTYPGRRCAIARGRPGRRPGDPADVLCSRPRCRFHTQSVNGGELTC